MVGDLLPERIIDEEAMPADTAVDARDCIGIDMGDDIVDVVIRIGTRGIVCQGMTSPASIQALTY